MRKLNARDRDGGVGERLESGHGDAAPLDRTMVLLNNVVQVFAASDLDVPPAGMLPSQQPQRPMTRHVSIERDLARHSRRLGLKSLAEERLSGCDAAIGAKQKIDRLAVFVDGAVQEMPLALDGHIGFIRAPRGTDCPGESVPALLKLWNVASDPPQDRRVGDLHTALGHHLHEVAIRQPIGNVPSYAQLNDLGIEGALAVHRVTRNRLRHPAPTK
jgi:hypothetical protein